MAQNSTAAGLQGVDQRRIYQDGGTAVGRAGARTGALCGGTRTRAGTGTHQGGDAGALGYVNFLQGARRVVRGEPLPEPVTTLFEESSHPPPSEEELQPLVLVLDQTKEQGAYDEIPGVLRRANPGLYKLVLVVGEIEEPICLVRGKEEQMERYLNRAMLIKGKVYWAEGIDIPVIQPVKIHLDPIIAE